MDSNIIAAIISSSVTIVTASIAIFLYYKGKRDSKRDAANMIYLELLDAERKIKNIKNSTNISDDIGPIMKHESWTKWKYLFVKNFDRDEWDSISEFYEKCMLYDEAIISNSATFSKNEEQIRINVHRIVADYIKEAVDAVAKKLGTTDPNKLKDSIDKIREKAETFQSQYLFQNEAIISKPNYSPQKYLDDREKFLQQIDVKISSRPVIQKLKKIAKIKP